jgi:predicted RNase H-like HicB family nuclease
MIKRFKKPLKNVTIKMCENVRNKTMDFWTVVLRKSDKYWVALCLENGIVGQGISDDDAMRNLKEAVDFLEEVRDLEKDIYSNPISINDLHEFLTIEGPEPVYERYELDPIRKAPKKSCR